MEKKRPTEVYTESNPNPNSLKFVVNYELLPPSTSVEYASIEEAGESPLSKELFGFKEINRVFITSNFVTVNKDAETDWQELVPEIRNKIKSFLETGQAVVTKQEAIEGEIQPLEDELEKKIQTVLEEYVKPAVEMDGGAIVFKSFDEGKLKVQLKGSCSGCPSSALTLKSGIENLMKRMVPEVEVVEAEDA